MIKKIFLLLGLLFFGAIAFSQNINNIEAELGPDNKIIVQYQISGVKFNQSFNLSLYVSLDGGETWEGPLKEVSGDIGTGIGKGLHKIYWDFSNEIPLISEELQFDIKAEVIEAKIKKSRFISLACNDITPFGLRYGSLGKTGFYIEARMSLAAFSSSSYTVKNGRIRDFDKAGYYELKDPKGWSACSAIVGINRQVGQNCFLFAGLGYAWENYLYNVDEYSYDQKEKLKGVYAKDNRISISGFEVDAGLIIRLNKIIISGGGSAINFQSFNWTAGIGFCF
jgi:hypothetical protein